jgi:hypothetical protein
MGCLARFSEILADYEHVTRRARFVTENGQDVFRGGQDRGKWFYLKLFNYLQHYALDAYEDFEGEDTFDLDAVEVLTVHQAKGLEWPVVFVPSLVQNRFPSKRAGQAQDWLLPASVFPAATRRPTKAAKSKSVGCFMSRSRARKTCCMRLPSSGRKGASNHRRFSPTSRQSRNWKIPFLCHPGSFRLTMTQTRHRRSRSRSWRCMKAAPSDIV